ncbi:hypothetical protein CVT25_010038 [Psilocybe cyanescens]|uniref:Uncharacterized protein n=1 Tax=Psilocybe cyanescens TaxID=93625 RepID=A0A409X3D9_PSICY|nr:hypothetical protein CVT25_010038 [Psilocybe cyanescens]
MPHFMAKQCRTLPPLFRLPDEILEEIVSELDLHSDLVAFALASRICADMVIPHHTQYRILRMRHTAPNIWAHLARRADLARNVREVHICEPSNLYAADHYPTALIDKQLDGNLENVDESVRIRNICRALGHMQRLRTFTWSWMHVPGQPRPTSHPAHENAIMTIVSQLPELEHFSLHGKFAMHALNTIVDRNSLMYPVWKLNNLRSLSLAGDTWAKLGNSKHICNLLMKSPNLEHLEVPLEFHHLAECRLPKLKHLKMVLQAGGVSFGLDHSRAVFLQNHPSIEVLNWSPIGNPAIPHDALPNLRSLRSNKQFVTALNDPEFGSNAPVLMTPPSTPVAVTTNIPAEPVPEPPVIMRKIENLDIYSLDAQMLLDLKYIDRTSLRRVNLQTFSDVSILHEIAEVFPNIEWLSLPPVHLPSGAQYPVPVSKDQWLDILPRFSKLQVFRGLGLWFCVKNDKSAMHDIIKDLVQVCPRLRVLDRLNRHNDLDNLKEIVITRNGEQGEIVNYMILPKPSRNPFDVMDGLFN